MDKKVKTILSVFVFASVFGGLGYINLSQNNKITLLERQNEEIHELLKNNNKHFEDIIYMTKENEINGLGKLTSQQQNDKEIVLKAVSDNGLDLRFASPTLRDDKEVVTFAVEQNGWALEYASPRLKNDKEIVMKAILNDPWSMKFASIELKNDKTFALEVLRTDGTILCWLSDFLKNDLDVVSMAIQQNDLALKFASPKLKNNEVIRKIMIMK